MAELKLDHVTVNVPVATQVKTLLQDVTLTVKTGEFVTVLGHNGAGKSTLFNAITGDLPAAARSLWLAKHSTGAVLSNVLDTLPEFSRIRKWEPPRE